MRMRCVHVSQHQSITAQTQSIWEKKFNIKRLQLAHKISSRSEVSNLSEKLDAVSFFGQRIFFCDNGPQNFNLKKQD